MRNESVSILVLSYIIGFTTAYIGFGTNQHDDFVAYDNQPAAVVASQTISQEEPESTIEDVYFDEVGMFAEVGDESIIISGVLSEDMEAGPGFHVDVPVYKISPSGKFVYYCEQESAEDKDCNEYVYSLDSHTLHPVKLNNVRQTSSLEESSFVWLADDSAYYGGFSSVSNTEPWLFPAE